MGARLHPGFEPLASGPTSLVNRSRRTIAQLLGDLAIDWQGPGKPPSTHGVSNLLELVGDYTNPILQPWAAEVVKKFGEMSSAGVGFPSPRNQCWPGGVPFVFTSGAIQILQHPDRIVILYNYDHQVRHVRLNESHPAQVTPTWYGDSIGTWEGDTLMVDTTGFNDRFWFDAKGHPHTEQLHTIEPQPRKDARAPDAIGVGRHSLIDTVYELMPADFALEQENGKVFRYARSLVEVELLMQVVRCRGMTDFR